MSRVLALIVFGCLLSIVAANAVKRELSQKDVLDDEGVLLGKDDLGNEYGLAYNNKLEKPVLVVKTIDGEIYVVDVDALPKEALETLAQAEVEDFRKKRDVNWEGQNVNSQKTDRRRTKRWLVTAVTWAGKWLLSSVVSDILDDDK